MQGIALVGLDVHKRMTSVAIAEADRGGEVRYLGEIPSSAEALRRLVGRLTKDGRRPSFRYQAGPCGYGVYRQLSGSGTGLQRGRGLPDPESAGRSGEDQPARRDAAGEAASGGRADPGMGAGPCP